MENAYAKAGVDVTAGYEVVARIKKHVKRTERLGVMGALGGFGGCFDLSELNVKETCFGFRNRWRRHKANGRNQREQA
jgi:phosphoribosylformylglycinamidine cyclo-ligase